MELIIIVGEREANIVEAHGSRRGWSRERVKIAEDRRGGEMRP